MGEMADMSMQDGLFPDEDYDQAFMYDGQYYGDEEVLEEREPCEHTDSYSMLHPKTEVINDLEEKWRKEEEEDEKPSEYSPAIDVNETHDHYWIRFGNPEQSSSFYGDWEGKYLFFSDNQEKLIDIAKHEIKEFGFKDAKVSIKPNNRDYVLCLYWNCDERGYELMTRYGNIDGVKYRWWKSNEDTRNGKYSKQHKQR